MKHFNLLILLFISFNSCNSVNKNNDDLEKAIAKSKLYHSEYETLMAKEIGLLTCIKYEPDSYISNSDELIFFRWRMKEKQEPHKFRYPLQYIGVSILNENPDCNDTIYLKNKPINGTYRIIDLNNGTFDRYLPYEVIANFKDGLKVGDWKYYANYHFFSRPYDVITKDHKPIRTEHYENGKLNGESIEFFNESVYLKTTYEKGKLKRLEKFEDEKSTMEYDFR